MYRDIEPGMSGVDVDELQQSLAALGDYWGPITGVLDASTKAAVARLYSVAGYSPPTTDGGDGKDAAAIETDRNTLNNAASTLNSDKTHKASAATIATDEQAVTTAQQALDMEIAQTGTTVPRDEIVFVPRLPATVTQVGTGIGYAPGSPLFTLSPAALALTTEVPTGQAGFLHVGSSAEVGLPSGQVTGTVTAISGTSAAGETTVSISTPKSLPISLQGADVKVTFVAASTSGNVLAVPQGAIQSDPNGNLSVIVEAANNSLTRVPVTVGVTGTDLVQVTPNQPGDLSAGDKVVIGG